MATRAIDKYLFTVFPLANFEIMTALKKKGLTVSGKMIVKAPDGYQGPELYSISNSTSNEVNSFGFTVTSKSFLLVSVSPSVS